MELVCVKQNLVKSCIAKSQCTAFFNPCSGRLGRRNIDLVVTACSNFCTQLTHDVLFFQHIDQAAVIFLRHEITAVRIHAFLQDIGHLLEVGTESRQHTFTVFIGRPACLRFPIAAGLLRVCQDRRADGPVQLVFHRLHLLHALDLGTVILNFLLHFCIGLGILL